jgi:murein DD-endopeptidase MepM/ murein hydrolase activator NlpD
VTALVALLSLVLSADPRAQLGAVEARHRAEAAAARLLADQERSVLDGLEEAETAATLAAQELARAEGLRATAELALARAAAAEGEASARLQGRLAELRPRLAARARLGPAGAVAALLSSPTLAELVKRHWALERILARDAALVGAARIALADRERARAEREAEAGRLAAAAAEARTRREQATARREERETLLAALRQAKAFHERLAGEAAVQSRRLAAFVATLPPPRAGGPRGAAFASRKGKLLLPAEGTVSVAFGKVVNPKFNTVTVQNGIDIEAPAGAPVQAVAPGRVVHAGWFKGYGNLVIVDHGDGYHTLVAHLASMRTAMGEDVDPGDVLGTVGDSASLKGPYLYFELREKGRPIDPRPWLAP